MKNRIALFFALCGTALAQTIPPGVGVYSLTGGSGGAAGSVPFSGITSGTNTTAAMVVGTGGSLTASGTGTIQATQSAASSISGQTGLLTFTGLTSTSRVKTLRDASDTILELGGSYTPTGTWTFTSATVTATTQSAADSSTKLATTAFINASAQSLTGTGSVNIDCSTSRNFYTTVTGNVTYAFTNAYDGMTIVVDILGDASHTVTFTGAKWAGGVAPTQTLSQHDLYSFKQINSRISGTVSQNMQ